MSDATFELALLIGLVVIIVGAFCAAIFDKSDRPES